jgi:hypothetical protein
MMTATGTKTATFTITDARYVGAKVGADLRLRGPCPAGR